MQSTILLALIVLLAPCLAFVAPVTTAPLQRSLSSRVNHIDQRRPAADAAAFTAECLAEAAIGLGERASRTALGAVRQVTAEELEKELTEWDLPLILDVFAVWCGPCLMLKPELEKVAEALEGKCRVLKMDSDEESDMASSLNVYGLPTVLYMKDGLIKHKTEGSMPAEEILQLADVHLFDGVPLEDPADSLFIDTTM